MKFFVLNRCKHSSDLKHLVCWFMCPALIIYIPDYCDWIKLSINPNCVVASLEFNHMSHGFTGFIVTSPCCFSSFPKANGTFKLLDSARMTKAIAFTNILRNLATHSQGREILHRCEIPTAQNQRWTHTRWSCPLGIIYFHALNVIELHYVLLWSGSFKSAVVPFLVVAYLSIFWFW